MGDFDSILLLNSLRVALNSLDQNPELDGRHQGIRELRDRLREEIEYLEPGVKTAIEQMPEPSLGVPT